MLVLSRKRDERVEVKLPDGGTATIVVCSVDGSRVRLGFEFPEGYDINRPDAKKRPPQAA